MREIKFRAWDTYYKQMYDVKGMVQTPAGTWEIWDGETAILPCNIILMQYTGLHDKNGKEIYESDILLPDKDLILTLYTHPKHLVEVVYEYGFFGARDLGTRHGRIDGGMMVNPDDWMGTEVIGNIYENKELPEAK